MKKTKEVRKERKGIRCWVLKSVCLWTCGTGSVLCETINDKVRVKFSCSQRKHIGVALEVSALISAVLRNHFRLPELPCFHG
jgi:hypothetical protein